MSIRRYWQCPSEVIINPHQTSHQQHPQVWRINISLQRYCSSVTRSITPNNFSHIERIITISTHHPSDHCCSDHLYNRLSPIVFAVEECWNSWDIHQIAMVSAALRSWSIDHQQDFPVFTKSPAELAVWTARVNRVHQNSPPVSSNTTSVDANKQCEALFLIVVYKIQQEL